MYEQFQITFLDTFINIVNTTTAWTLNPRYVTKTLYWRNFNASEARLRQLVSYKSVHKREIKDVSLFDKKPEFVQDKYNLHTLKCVHSIVESIPSNGNICCKLKQKLMNLWTPVQLYFAFHFQLSLNADINDL